MASVASRILGESPFEVDPNDPFGVRRVDPDAREAFETLRNYHRDDAKVPPVTKKKLEGIVATSALYSYFYALEVLKGKRFKRGEPVIACSPTYARQYARDILRGPFPEAEPAIATDATESMAYSKYVIKRPFPMGEKVILENPTTAYQYARHVLLRPWPEAESVIAKSPSASILYASEVLGYKPFPEGEAAIATLGEYAQYYALYCLKRRFPEGEEAMVRDGFTSDYVKKFPEAKLDWAVNGLIDWIDL